MTDELFDGRRIRMVTIVNLFKCESISIEAGHRFRGSDAAQILAQFGYERELPKTIRVDNGPELLTAVEKCGARRRKTAALGVKKYQGFDDFWC